MASGIGFQSLNQLGKSARSLCELARAGSHQIAEIIQGVKFKDGEKLTES
jgi:hypothetical protein